jgi:non-specific protein-tyrosine kinase
MNLKLYLLVARRWIIFAILPALVVAAAAYLKTARQAKTYETSATLYVQVPDTSSPGNTDVYASQQLIPTYSQILTLPAIAHATDRAMAARYPGYRIEAHGLSTDQANAVSQNQATQLLDVTVTDTIPARAAAAANAVANAFIADITTLQKERYAGGQQALTHQMDQAQANIQIVSQRIATYKGSTTGLDNLKSELNAYTSIFQTLLSSQQEFNVNRNTAVKSVKLLSPAPVPTSPIGPHPSRSALLDGFVALLVCAGGVFAYDYFDDSARTPEEVEGLVGAPILGTVQQFASGVGGLVTAQKSHSPMSEAYRIMRTNLQYTDIDHPPRVIVVTSASPAEGKSTTASNLAHVMAEAGRRVILVDGDLRRPSLHRIFGVQRSEGLTAMLIGTEGLNGHSGQATDLSTLSLVASGPTPPRPADLLASNRLREVIDHFAHEADMVVIDSPPILAVTDAAVISTVTDGVVLVVDPARSKRRDLTRAREAVEAVGGRILGVVINRLTKQGSGYYYYYYQHNYGYKYQYRYGEEQSLGATPVGDTSA